MPPFAGWHAEARVLANCASLESVACSRQQAGISDCFLGIGIFQQPARLGTSNAGIYRSSDQGAHWSPLNNGLGNLQIRAIVTAKGTAYTATAVGVFKYGN